jgi:hypothetical protein
VLRKHPAGRPGSFRWGRPIAWLAVALSVANLVMLVVGGVQWGISVVLIGVCVSLLILPISYATRRFTTRRAMVGAAEAAAPL